MGGTTRDGHDEHTSTGMVQPATSVDFVYGSDAVVKLPHAQHVHHVCDSLPDGRESRLVPVQHALQRSVQHAYVCMKCIHAKDPFVPFAEKSLIGAPYLVSANPFRCHLQLSRGKLKTCNGGVLHDDSPSGKCPRGTNSHKAAG